MADDEIPKRKVKTNLESVFLLKKVLPNISTVEKGNSDFPQSPCCQGLKSFSSISTRSKRLGNRSGQIQEVLPSSG